MGQLLQICPGKIDVPLLHNLDPNDHFIENVPESVEKLRILAFLKHFQICTSPVKLVLSL